MKKTFTKEERLCSNRRISNLFKEGNTFHVRPFRVKWMFLPAETGMPVEVLFSVPKYNVHKAVDRNLIRRRSKESYRLNKCMLYESLAGSGRRMALALTYTARETVAFNLIESKIILILRRLIEENEKVTG